MIGRFTAIAGGVEALLLNRPRLSRRGDVRHQARMRGVDCQLVGRVRAAGDAVAGLARAGQARAPLHAIIGRDVAVRAGNENVGRGIDRAERRPGVVPALELEDVGSALGDADIGGRRRGLGVAQFAASPRARPRKNLRSIASPDVVVDCDDVVAGRNRIFRTEPGDCAARNREVRRRGGVEETAPVDHERDRSGRTRPRRLR